MHHDIEIECLCTETENEYTDQKAEIGKTGNDKCFFRSGNCRRSVIIKSNQQVGRNANQFPENIDLKNIRSDNEPEHGKSKQRKKRIIGSEPLFAFHVAKTKNMNHQRNESYYHQHHH